MTKVLFRGPVNELGYGVHFSSLVTALLSIRDGEMEFVFENIGRSTNVGLGSRPSVATAYRTCKEHEQRLDTTFDVCVTLYTPPVQPRFIHPRAKTNVFMTVWETSRPHPSWLEGFKAVDAVFVPTDYNYVSLPGGIYCCVVPEGGYLGEDHDWTVDTGDLRYFLSVGKYEKRKGQLELLGALSRVRTDVDCTIGLWNDPFDPGWLESVLRDAWKLGYKPETRLSRRIRESRVATWIPDGVYIRSATDNLVCIVDNIQFNALLSLQRNALAGIFPHAAEGWGLAVAEQACLGGSLVANFETGTCGGKWFATSIAGNTWHLSSNREVAWDGRYFKDRLQGHWFPVAGDDLDRALTASYQPLPPNQENRSLLGWNRAAEKFIQAIKEIA